MSVLCCRHEGKKKGRRAWGTHWSVAGAKDSSVGAGRVLWMMGSAIVSWSTAAQVLSMNDGVTTKGSCRDATRSSAHHNACEFLL